VRVLVCGGRDYSDEATLNSTLSELHRDIGFHTLVHGDASGADRLAGLWANANGKVKVETYPANWSKHGKSAGPKRNALMLSSDIDLVVAFSGGRGTSDMIRKAKAAGVQVLEIEEKG